MKPVYIDWEKQDLTIIEKNGYMTKVRDEYSGGEGLIPDREIYFLMKSLMYICFCHHFLLSEKVSGYRSLTKMKQCLW